MHYTFASAINDQREQRMSGDNAWALRFSTATKVRERKKPKSLDLGFAFQILGYCIILVLILRCSLG